MDEFLKRYARSECVKLNMMMQKGDGTIKSAVSNILKKLNMDSKKIARHAQKYDDDFEEQFVDMMEDAKMLDTLISRTNTSLNKTNDSNNLSRT